MGRSGGGGAGSDQVARLTAKGFGKAKATQALKDAGNNVELALRILERQQQQQQQQQQPPSQPNASLIPSLQRARPPVTSPLFASPSPAVAEARRQAARRHPCVVQYGSCQYGPHCVLKDLPGDVCVQHIQGGCIYGSSCRHRHYIDGVDVHDTVWGSAGGEGHDAGGDVLVAHGEDGGVFRVVPGSTGTSSKLQTATRITPVRDGLDDDAARTMRAPPLQSSDFNRIRGSAPSHTDPIAPPPRQPTAATFVGESDDEDGAEDGEDEGGATGLAHPTPFRDLVRTAATASAGDAKSPAVCAAAPVACPAAPVQPPPPARSRARHPCVAQYDSCKFGDACAHADRDADVCVHFLNGRCRYTADACRYRHETEAELHASLRARAGLAPLPDAAGTGLRDSANGRDAAPALSRASGKPKKNRLQGVAVAGSGATSAAAAASTPPASDRDVSSHSYSALPSIDDLPALSDALRASTADLDSFSCLGSASPHGDADVEMRVFLGLVEAYPAVEPAVVLQALRVSGGDAIRASDVIHHVGVASTTDSVDDVAAALALAAAEDAAEREAAADHAAVQERHNGLLTLLALFPAVEPAAVEAVLQQHHDAFADAYSTLLCAQENVARSAMWSGSTAAMTPADQLRLEKLRVMFPGLDGDVVRSAFCAADRQWTRATTALNELTKELLGLDAAAFTTRTTANPSAGRKVVTPVPAVEWRPASSSTEAPAAAPLTRAALRDDAAAAHDAAESSEAAYQAYRAAEQEILAYGDWRRVREQAYLINAQRLRVLGQATAAFLNGDGRTARLLSREGRRLGLEYNRLNRLAMLALEQERLRGDATSTLDLHGFHTAEVHDVLVRRVQVCRRHRVAQLRIVTGEGKHSRRGHQTLYPAVMEELRTDTFLSSTVKVKSIKAGYLDVAVRLPPAES